ncbi:hypothetical protein BDC45DRAFT_77086 [Circinella umbellata]|nr:hypothetical protein BDC45DRAFT_77086 [Circinella umbellata]
MVRSIRDIMNEVMEKYFEDEVLCKTKEKKQKMMGTIIKEKIEKTNTTHFWHLNSSSNVCTYVHKRGKKEGYICHKKIRTNILDGKPDYLCSTHSKKHIPKKRTKKEQKKKLPCVINNKICFKKDIKKRKKRKMKPIYICSDGILNFTDVINKIMQ